MLVKLAKRNVKRQIGNYLVYFATVTLSIAMMFAFCNLIFSEQLSVIAEKNEGISSGMIGLTVFVAIVTAFVLSYASSYMLKLRKKEFGTYLTLGMKRSDILKIFSCETLLIFLIALLTGIVSGAFISQGLTALLCVFMGIGIKISSYCIKGLALTIALAAAMFVFMLFVSSRYLKKVSIHELLLAEKSKKEIKHTSLWGVASAVGFAVMALSFYGIYYGTKASLTKDSNMPLLFFIFLMSVGVFVFHSCFSASFNGLLLKNEKLKARSTNTFLFRQLSNKVGVNATLLGFISLLLVFTVLGTNLCFTEKVMQQAVIDRETPFDVTARFNVNSDHGISLAQGEEIIKKYSPVKQKQSYKIWTTGKNELGKNLPGIEDDYTDSYMALSEFNGLLAMNGKEPVDLKNGCFIVTTYISIAVSDILNRSITLNGKNYKVTGASTEYPLYTYLFFYAVVPDEAIKGMTLETEYASYDLVNDRYDAYSLAEELTWQSPDGEGGYYDINNFDLREYARLESDAQVGVLIIGAMYAAVVFICMAFAILSMKTLSSVDDDKKRYELLFRFGVSKDGLKKTLFKQLFFYFMVPFAVPFLICLPTGLMLADIMKLMALSSLAPSMILVSAIIAAVFAVVYMVYFFITYSIAKKNICSQL